MNRLFLSCLSLCLSCQISLAQSKYWGPDNGDGTYTNPIIHGDYPDPDIIRVEDDYYMVSSSFVAMPGIPICHSKDLLNWKIIGHAYNKLTMRPEFSMTNGKTAYSQVSWAPTIRHHKGTFYIGVNSPNVGYIMFKSKNPEGPYDMHVFSEALYDPGLFIDDDDKMYVVHGRQTIYLTELNEDGTNVKEGAKAIPIITPPAEYMRDFEGSHAYKYMGWYYVFNACHGYNGKQAVSRSRKITGPYETRIIINDAINYPRAGVHQGGMVITAKGEPWAYTFQDRDYMGRDLMMYPMRWEDGWPVVGVKGRETKGVVTHRKPDIDGDVVKKSPQESDDFSSTTLKPVWEFNHAALDSHWSLSERPGFLRIRSSAADSWLTARNTLTQKVAGPAGSVTTKIDLSGLKKGDLGGIMMFAKPYSLLGVLHDGKNKVLQMRLQEEKPAAEQPDQNKKLMHEVVKDAVVIPADTLYLRVNLTNEGKAYYSYSFDNKAFTRLGIESTPMYWFYLGIRYALFCYNTTQAADEDCGSIDFDDFVMTCTRNGNHYNAREWVKFSQYDDQEGCTPVRPGIREPLVHLTEMQEKAWIQFNNLHGMQGSKSITLRYKSPTQDKAIIELRKDSPDGQVIKSIAIPMGGNTQHWCEMRSELTIPEQVGKIFFVIKGDTQGLELREFKMK